jgi:hypothetical protein
MGWRCPTLKSVCTGCRAKRWLTLLGLVIVYRWRPVLTSPEVLIENGCLMSKPVEQVVRMMIEVEGGGGGAMSAAMVFHGELKGCECGDSVPNYLEDEEGVVLCLTCVDQAMRNGDLRVARVSLGLVG